MREKVSVESIERFMKALGRAGRTNARIYFVGGVSAVLLGREIPSRTLATKSTKGSKRFC